MIPTALFAAAVMQAPVAPAAPAPDFGWMSGYWLDCDNGREVSEVWSDPRNGMVVGVNVTTRNGRTGFEYARIVPVEGTISYVAQPDGAPPTVFAQVESGDRRAVFLNPDEDDYPRRIIYHRTGDVLRARIEGVIDGRERNADWRFQKAELNSRCPTP